MSGREVGLGVVVLAALGTAADSAQALFPSSNGQIV
jgi:hypothetical protein